MLTWITTRSISVPWLKISLRSSLSSTGFVPSGIRSFRLAGANSLSGNSSRSMTTPIAYFISSSSSTTSLPSLPTSGGRSRRPLTRMPSTVQVARHQGGSTAIETKSRAWTLSVRVNTTQATARGRITR